MAKHYYNWVGFVQKNYLKTKRIADLFLSIIDLGDSKKITDQLPFQKI